MMLRTKSRQAPPEGPAISITPIIVFRSTAPQWCEISGSHEPEISKFAKAGEGLSTPLKCDLMRQMTFI